MDENVIIPQVVQQQATVKDIIDAHLHGVGGYAIAEKYGLDPKKVEEVIAQADKEGKFIPPGVEAPVDRIEDAPVQPLVEGENPEPAEAPVEAEAVEEGPPAPGTGRNVPDKVA